MASITKSPLPHDGWTAEQVSHWIGNSEDLSCPGGVQEVLALNKEKPDDIILFLRKRKGFIKMVLL